MEENKELILKSPWLFPAIPLPAAALGMYVIAKYGVDGSDGWFPLAGILAMIAVARLASSPRLKIAPDAIVYPKGWITMTPRRIAWSEIRKAEFQLVSGFAWPMLILELQGREAPLGVRFLW